VAIKVKLLLPYKLLIEIAPLATPANALTLAWFKLMAVFAAKPNSVFT
jgi:hypothetical protein